MDITIKRCSKCGRLLPLEDFTTDNRRKDGINPKHPVEAIKEYLQSAIYKALKGYSDFGEKLFNEYMTEYTKSYAGRR